MIAVKVELTGHPTEAVVRVQAFLASNSMRNIAGFEGQRTVREHLQGLDETRANKLGGRRSHYYGSARRATEYFLDGDDVVISIAQVGMKLHYYGGTVEAGKNTSFATGEPTKYLTIPAAPEAYGKTVRDFPDLVVVWGAGRKPVGLAIGEEPTGSLYAAVRGGRGALMVKATKLVPGKVMFWLKQSVTLQPDPTILPSMETLGTNITDRVGKAIARRFGGLEVDDQEGGAGI